MLIHTMWAGTTHTHEYTHKVMYTHTYTHTHTKPSTPHTHTEPCTPHTHSHAHHTPQTYKVMDTSCIHICTTHIHIDMYTHAHHTQSCISQTTHTQSHAHHTHTYIQSHTHHIHMHVLFLHPLLRNLSSVGPGQQLSASVPPVPAMVASHPKAQSWPVGSGEWQTSR